MYTPRIGVAERRDLDRYRDVSFEYAVIYYVKIEKHIFSHLVREFVKAQIEYDLIREVGEVLVEVLHIGKPVFHAIVPEFSVCQGNRECDGCCRAGGEIQELLLFAPDGSIVRIEQRGLDCAGRKGREADVLDIEGKRVIGPDQPCGRVVGGNRHKISGNYLEVRRREAHLFAEAEYLNLGDIAAPLERAGERKRITIRIPGQQQCLRIFRYFRARLIENPDISSYYIFGLVYKSEEIIRQIIGNRTALFGQIFRLVD